MEPYSEISLSWINNVIDFSDRHFLVLLIVSMWITGFNFTQNMVFMTRAIPRVAGENNLEDLTMFPEEVTDVLIVHTIQ